ncbi:acyl-CoA dehydrogenase family protein [Roseomonas mucosa]|uniref:acyl-CoA dehydrogenase family protein n=1 Tax=Roseomonas mucosa TaxID=207340 RepID=UPI00396A346B
MPDTIDQLRSVILETLGASQDLPSSWKLLGDLLMEDPEDDSSFGLDCTSLTAVSSCVGRKWLPFALAETLVVWTTLRTSLGSMRKELEFGAPGLRRLVRVVEMDHQLLDPRLEMATFGDDWQIPSLNALLPPLWTWNAGHLRRGLEDCLPQVSTKRSSERAVLNSEAILLRFALRLQSAAYLLGALETALDRTMKYVTSRVIGGSPLGDKQVVRHRIAQAYLEIRSLDLLVRRAVQGEPGSDLNRVTANMAYLHACRLVDGTLRNLIQLHGAAALTQAGFGTSLLQAKIDCLRFGTEHSVEEELGLRSLDKTPLPSFAG